MLANPSSHRYGWLPDHPDHRDRPFLPRVKSRGLLPPRVDWTPAMPPVYDQGQLGSCTANALCAAHEFLKRSPIHAAVPAPSRLFLYYNERECIGTVNEDSGAMIRDGVKSMLIDGLCPETLWPYDPSAVSVRPSDACYQIAAANELLEYRRVDNSSLPDLLEALTCGPVVGGFTVYSSFESATVAKTGIVPMPGRNDSAQGGHAILVVGYDQPANQFIVRNSWGARWGKGGYFRIPFEYFTNPNLSDDFWLLTQTTS